MIYKFKSKASGDIIMMGPTGDALLRAIGRAPAPKGIIEPAAMAAAMTAIEQAVLADEAARADAEREAAARGERLAPRGRGPAPAAVADGGHAQARCGRRRAGGVGRVGDLLGTSR
jgi:hypothetical protein